MATVVVFLGFYLFSTGLSLFFTFPIRQMLQNLSHAARSRRQAAYKTIGILLVCICLFWLFDKSDQVSVDLFETKDSGRKSKHNVGSMLFRRAPPLSVSNLPRPHFPLERELAEIDALFNSNEMIPPPPSSSAELVSMNTFKEPIKGTDLPESKLQPSITTDVDSSLGEAKDANSGMSFLLCL
jgi:hypothetical protein